MNMKNKQIVTSFIETVWNENQLEKMDNYLHPSFVDHSLPPALPPTREGLIGWIVGTNKSFENQTVIEEIVSEGDKVMLKIKMLLKHIGKWRDIEPQGAEVFAVGYRYFKLADDKIIEHWALIDGNTIENQLKEANHGCKIQE